MVDEPGSGEDIFASLIAHISQAVRSTLVAKPASPGARSSAEDIAVLEELAEGLSRVRYHRPVAAAAGPTVDQWLDQAEGYATGDDLDFLRLFRRCAQELLWNVAYPDHRATPLMERFWGNYSYAGVAVPVDGICQPGPCRSDAMALFLVAQGADVVYPKHHHPAVEVYGIVAGSGLWLRGDQEITARLPGDVFVHHSGVEHATTTAAEPSISWVAWLGDLHTRPAMP